jgi:hypothetical protein
MGGLPDRNFVKLSCEFGHCCGLTDVGKIKCMGSNDDGESDVPAGRYIDVAVQGHISCGVHESGRVQCWGHASEEALDLDGESYLQLSSLAPNFCLLDQDGKVECPWSEDLDTHPLSEGPYEEVVAGKWHVCGQRGDGEWVCWGDNMFGFGKYREISLGGQYHGCGILNDGGVKCWGGYDGGWMVPDSSEIVQVATGMYHACGLMNDGSITCWWEHSSRPQVGTQSAPLEMIR